MPSTTYTPQLTFLSDPGHGWLVVPLADIARSDCANQISRYSFIDTRDGVAYLEEDCDVARYLEALEAAGISRPQIVSAYTEQFDRGRFLRFGDARFDAAFWSSYATAVGD
ncbi:MAG: hypothetical protein M9928_11420 [Anaerolineae bacterium]|nr:hypothetical protein [Anaerolineae bacterium]MCO5188159.1 hypothetical protein [Anaerolineae bacterium]MCO5193032.1 hypothetical protein [Anaerolineae bacterium]MCO5205634.1 hypothetical protein [Anaerolineae bacterium]